MSRAIMILAGLALFYLVFLARSEPVHAKRVILEVETPTGVVSGGTVVELKSFQAPWWYPAGGTKSGMVSQGEALHLDLGGGKHLFVLMNDQVQKPIRDSLMPNRLEADGRFKHGEAPVMVTFADITDATSVRKVAPEDLGVTFGSGYALRSFRAVATQERLFSAG